VKVAAAVLGASLLFFFGVLTGAGRREAIPPPAAITLGAGSPASSADGATSPKSPPSTSRATQSTRPGAGSNPSPATTATTTRTDATAPGGPTAPVAPPATTAPTGAGGDGTATSTTTAGPGQTEQVDNKVDCRSARKPGKGKREPCPSTTTSTGEAPGGAGNR
jgi:hypothetical protein